MIKNDSVEVLVRQSEKLPVFRVLKDAAYNLVNSLVERDNRPLHVDFRWYSRWLRSIGSEHVYEVRVCVIYGYVEPSHCLNSGDLLYYTQADPQQKTLRTIDPIRPLTVVCLRGAIPPIAPQGKTRTFYRQRFLIRMPSVKCELNQKIEAFKDYWELA